MAVQLVSLRGFIFRRNRFEPPIYCMGNLYGADQCRSKLQDFAEEG